MADLLGIHTPPGRPGIPEFDQAILSKLAFEIAPKEDVSSDHPSPDLKIKKLHIENDLHGGAGRAGYVEAESGTWLNLKGSGPTGVGRASNRIGPPMSTFSSHQDGSVTLEEAIKEAVMARMADSELSRGAARVVAIIDTGRVMTYPNGNTVPLALIVRAPLRRLDQDLQFRRAAATQTIAEANSKRIMKGDFSIESNMGAGGECVDFGCMTHTYGYGAATSSQHLNFMKEAAQIANSRVTEARDRWMGAGLLGQLGIPQEHVLRLLGSGKLLDGSLQRLGAAFAKVVEGQQEFLLDLEPPTRELLEGDLRLHHWMRDLAAEYISAPDNAIDALPDLEARKLAANASAKGGLSETRIECIQELSRAFAQCLNPVRGSIPPEQREGFASNVKKVAAFKNRDVTETLRPRVVYEAGKIAKSYLTDHDPSAIQHYIENAVLDSRTSTHPTSDSWISVTADSSATHLYIRRKTGSDGVSRLFEYPELSGAGPGEVLYFRISTDGGRSHQDVRAEQFTNRLGDYFRIDIPHGHMPVTEERIRLTPFVKTRDGHDRWLKDHFDLRGPPLMLNERLGMEKSLIPRTDAMRTEHSRAIRVLPQDMDGASTATAAIPNDELRLLLHEASSDDVSISENAHRELSANPTTRELIQTIANSGAEPLPMRRHKLKVTDLLKRRGLDPSQEPELSRWLLKGRLRAPDALADANVAETFQLVFNEGKNSLGPVLKDFLSKNKELMSQQPGYGRFLSDLARGDEAQFRFLSELKDPRATAALFARFRNSESTELKKLILDTTRTIAPNSPKMDALAQRIYTTALKDPNESVRYSAIWGISAGDPEQAFSRLTKAFDGQTDPKSLQTIVRQLSSLKLGENSKKVADFIFKNGLTPTGTRMSKRPP